MNKGETNSTDELIQPTIHTKESLDEVSPDLILMNLIQSDVLVTKVLSSKIYIMK